MLLQSRLFDSVLNAVVFAASYSVAFGILPRNLLLIATYLLLFARLQNILFDVVVFTTSSSIISGILDRNNIPFAIATG